MRTYLHVPFDEKDLAKSAGAKWDGIEQRWYVDAREDLTPFLRWMPAQLLAPARKPLRVSPTGSGKSNAACSLLAGGRA